MVGGAVPVTLLLPPGVRACLFDLDGVLTQTAQLHAAVWKQTFDDLLQRRAKRDGEVFRPFDEIADYDMFVDGKTRADGTRSFLTSRGIRLPEGAHDDPPAMDTVNGVGNRKNELLLRRMAEAGVQPYRGSVAFVTAALAAGLRCAVVSSSENCRQALVAAGISDLFQARIDGVVARRRQLRGKPSPDTYLAAAHDLGVPAAAAAVFEDALAGVEAGRAGEFGFVVGVDRIGQADQLRAHGADIVVSDLSELLRPAS